MKADLKLADYIPNCELVLPKSEIAGPKFPVIDAHTHLGRMMMGDHYAEMYDICETIGHLKSYGVEHIVNLDGEEEEYLDKMLEKCSGFEDFIVHFGAADASGFDAPNFEKRTYSSIRKLKQRGVKGLKYWKTIGLRFKGKDGAYLRVDDERLKVIWQTAAELDLPVTIHIADPTAFFRPIGRINERYEELIDHPDWSFYGEGRYTFEDLMEQQEALIFQNPRTTFIVAHVGSYSENLAQVSAWLDRYPNMNVDIAERISELGRQPYTSRAFLQKYSDRVVFGSDMYPLDVHRYARYYRFLETYDEYFPYHSEKYQIPPQGRWYIYGIGLDDVTLKKLYNLNIKRILKMN